MNTDIKGVTREEARKTAFVVAVVLVGATAWFLYRGRMNVVIVLGAIAAVLFLVGAFVAPAAKVFHRVWMKIAFALGYVNSRIILTLVYCLVFVPYRFISRLRGRDPLDLRSENHESYWHRREKTRPDNEQFERLF
ncbi:MAG: hypothetical protein IPG67_01045 [Acidobacteria bacterium]|nr:hypothetical protein [Acidobacteriota bacterium]MBK7934141.1 hypothetical protein [Acidobacteriota bacterium]